MSLLKSLEAIGKAADHSIIKASSAHVNVYVSLPLEVVKIETVPPQATFAKLGRLITQAINSAYATVLQTSGQKDLSQEDLFTVSADGNTDVIINGKMEIKEIGFKKAPAEEGDIEGFLRDVITATNTACMKAQIKAIELGKQLTQQ